MSDLIQDLQDGIGSLISADAWFQGRPGPRVLTEVLGDLESEIERELASTGLTVVVVTPELRNVKAGNDTMLEVDVVVGVGERPRVNRKPNGTQKTAFEARTRIIAILSGAQLDGGWRPLAFVRAAKGEASDDVTDFQLVFQTQIRTQIDSEA